MKYPTHIFLDLPTPTLTASPRYWILKYISFCLKNQDNSRFLNIKNVFLNKIYYKPLPLKFRRTRQFNLRFNTINPASTLNAKHLTFVQTNYPRRKAIKNRDLRFNTLINQIYKLLNPRAKKIADVFFVKYFLQHLHRISRWYVKIANSHALFNIFFVKKEKIYTKLKYSRTPAYDIVSGGIAALFAAFLGFLITEKFGFELIDSGDFYFLFMYVVILSFGLKPFLKLIMLETKFINSFSYKWCWIFWKTLTFLILKKLKNNV